MTDTNKNPPTLREAVANVIAEAHAEGPSAMADPKCHLRKVLMTVGYLQDLKAAHEAPGAYEDSVENPAEAERDELRRNLEQATRQHHEIRTELKQRVADLREKLPKAEHQTSGCCPQSEELARANAELREKLEKALAENTGLFERLGEPLLPPARPSFGDGSDAGGERDFSDPPKDREGDEVLRRYLAAIEERDAGNDKAPDCEESDDALAVLVRRALGEGGAS